MNEGHVKVSFVARIWLEHGNNGDARWRGHIRHVQGEEESYFQNLLEMRAFLSCVSGVAGLPVSTADDLEGAIHSGTVTNIKRKD